MAGPTLVKPPQEDPSKSPMENAIELTSLYQFGPDIYTNTRELWHPPGARGVYGGGVIAQCLSAAQKTVPAPSPENGNADFLPHSMHCYFVLAGDPNIPILYHVERVREGRSFLTRTVQARQRGRCIFTTTISFVLDGSGGRKTLDHGSSMPEGVREKLEQALKTEPSDLEKEQSSRSGVEATGPFLMKRLGVYNAQSPNLHDRKPQHWMRCRGKIAGGTPAHLNALAYMSDSWFLGTTARVHGMMAYDPTTQKSSPYLERLNELETQRNKDACSDFTVNNKPKPQDAQIGMMVSLDHTIYFHRPREFKADEWLCSEMQSPWTGDGRGLVTQQIWNYHGRLLATCVQEGLLRLKQDDKPIKTKL